MKRPRERWIVRWEGGMDCRRDGRRERGRKRVRERGIDELGDG